MHYITLSAGFKNIYCTALHFPKGYAVRQAVGFKQRSVRLAVGNTVAAGHKQINLGTDSVCLVAHIGELGALGFFHPPVGHNRAVIAPFSTQNGGAKVVIIMAVNAVNLVVGGHYAPWFCLLNANFKAFKVNFPKGTLG